CIRHRVTLLLCCIKYVCEVSSGRVSIQHKSASICWDTTGRRVLLTKTSPRLMSISSFKWIVTDIPAKASAGCSSNNSIFSTDELKPEGNTVTRSFTLNDPLETRPAYPR